jgi:hypothetical protein
VLENDSSKFLVDGPKIVGFLGIQHGAPLEFPGGADLSVK